MDAILDELESEYPEFSNLTIGEGTTSLIKKSISKNNIVMKPIIYTDGSCLRNPGPGGWCFCVIYENGEEWMVSDGEEETTNNRMELTAVIEALDFVRKDCVIYTDSQLTMKCGKGEWKRKVNLDLWSKFDEMSNGIEIEWNWVKAHNGNEYNEIVDNMAREEAKRMKNLKSCMK
tara:strand:+ start:141 stop:665 length:525 start_codon:yes stop_codon:yes gene_type:complete